MKATMNNESNSMTIELNGTAEIQVIINALEAYRLQYSRQYFDMATGNLTEGYNVNHATLIDCMHDIAITEYIK
jgi:hypothetical protein